MLSKNSLVYLRNSCRMLKIIQIKFCIKFSNSSDNLCKKINVLSNIILFKRLTQRNFIEIISLIVLKQ